MPIAVSVIEDDVPLRRTLAGMLDSNPAFRCVSQHGDVSGTLRDLPWDKTEVVLLDLLLPPPGGVELLRRIKSRAPKLPVLIFSQHADTKLVIDAIQAGADGYALKRAGLGQIEAGLQAVHRGEGYFPPSVARKLAERIRESAPAEARPFVRDGHLTPRETELLHLARKGLDYKEMAGHTGREYNTIRKHWDNIRLKLAAKSRAQAVARFFGL